ncbi:MAG: hypothetical protein WEA09_03280 [Gemmatimonadota bacterium]
MPTLRNSVNAALTIGGLIIAFAGILFSEDKQAQIIAVLAGFLLIEIGVWGLANPFLPSHRKFSRLRDEVDAFIGNVRLMNAAKLRARHEPGPEHEAQVAQLLADLHRQVDRIGELAGQYDGGVQPVS